jgi:hypothetical protein
MVIHGCVYNNVKKGFLLWEGGNFIMFLVIGQPNDSLQKKAIKTFVCWDAWQLIKLINVNHIKYLSSCKGQGKNGDEQS